MKITNKKQLIIGNSYYFTENLIQNLEHQPDGILVCEGKYDNWYEEQKVKYGFANNEYKIKVIEILTFVGKNTKKSDEPYYYTINWIGQKNFYTTLIEAQREGIIIAFAR